MQKVFNPVVIFTLLLFSTAVVGQDTIKDTSPEARCHLRHQGRCTACLKSKPILSTKNCGNLLPATDKCLLYKFNPVSKKVACGICKIGLAMHIVAGKPPTCIQSTFNNKNSGSSSKFCEVEIRMFRNTFCLACGFNHLAFIDKSSLGSSKTLCISKNDRRIKKGGEHCVWGGVDQNGEAKCYSCELGYSSQPVTAICKKATIGGCLKVKNGECVGCNVFEGYGMKVDRTCAKWE